MSTLNKVELKSGGVSTVYKVGNVVEGYLDKDHNKFYEDARYTIEINAESDMVYLSLDTNKQYRYDTTNSEFISISGGNDDHVYDDKAAMLADLANVNDGDIMYTKNDQSEPLSERVSALENGKQDKTDNTLVTDSKTIVGAINEVDAEAFRSRGQCTETDANTIIKAGIYWCNSTTTSNLPTNGWMILEVITTSTTNQNYPLIQRCSIATSDRGYYERRYYYDNISQTYKWTAWVLFFASYVKDLANGILGAKNVIPYPWYDTTKTINGITFTDNGNGTVTINGTATADCEFVFVANANNYKPIANTYRLTGIEGGSATTYFIQYSYNDGTITDFLFSGGKNYTVDGTKIIRISVRVKSGATVNNVTVSPMFRLADDMDTTFRPYAKTNKQLTDDVSQINNDKVDWKSNNILGAKNLIPYPYYESTKTQNGITYTDNGDGTVTANGTATADTIFLLRYRESHALKANARYKLTGCPSGGSNTTYYQWIGFWSGSTNVNSAYDTGSGVDLVVASASESYGLVIGCYVKSGQTVSNMVFKPMLRLASDTDSTYQPYAMTNKELTTPTFTQASTRANINSRETISTIFGKIKKVFADLKAVAFTGSYNDLTDKPEYLTKSVNIHSKPVFSSPKTRWIPKTWNGLTNPRGYGIWTDGENIYYSLGSTYVLDKSTSTWSKKTWNGLTSFNGENVWTDGENIYCSAGNKQYVLDRSTSTWNTKTWNGITSLNNFSAEGIWTDGDNIYYSHSYSNQQYVLDKATSTWNTKTWNGLTNPSGFYIWTDGENIYYSKNNQHYILDKSTSTWNTKTWTGLTSLNSFDGGRIWTDGKNTYYSSDADQYVLDKSTSTWNTKIWNGLTSFNGTDIWTDGENIYYSYEGTNYMLYTTDSVHSNKPLIL